MGIIERKLRNKEELRNLIIDSARHIINTEGIENLTMRKIALLIDYTPTTIYKYFQNKDELISAIIKETTKEIALSMETLKDQNLSNDMFLSTGLETYTKIMLAKSEHFKATIMNDMTSDKKFRIFSPDMSIKNSAISYIAACISTGIKDGSYREADIDSQTKFVWTSIYGLISRLIIEADIVEKERDMIIINYIQFVIYSLKK